MKPLLRRVALGAALAAVLTAATLVVAGFGPGGGDSWLAADVDAIGPGPASAVPPVPAASPEVEPVVRPSADVEVVPATPTTEPTPTVPPVPEPYAPAGNEASPDAKQLGVLIAHHLTNYEADTSFDEIAAAITEDAGRWGLLADAAATLHHPGMWSRGTVVYPQLGGLRPDSTSIMVVVRQEVGLGDTVELVETRTLDIRLSFVSDGWTFDELADAGGAPVARPDDLSTLASSVVDDERIELPDSAVWDIYAGRISPTLLRVMADLAETTAYGVVVLESGHPYHVFATDRVSNHSVGRAVDIYRLGDTRVIDGRDVGSRTMGLASWLLAYPDVNKVGSPWVLDRSGRSFTDDVHQDHLHVSIGGP